MESRLIGLLIIQLWQCVTWAAVLKDRAFAEKYLKQYHFIGPDSPSKEIERLLDSDPDEAYRQGLVLFQEFAHINVSGILDKITNAKMHSRRCGMPDIISLGNLVKRKKRYTLQGSFWNRTQLTYKVENYPDADLTQREVDDIIDQGFKVWSTVTLLEFIRLEAYEEADINVRYDKYWHGDNFPFDGYGGSLAHAFFPFYGGDIHFDDNEIWTSGTNHGTNMLQVTVHEIGHSLGLAHSSNPQSLMASFYKGYSEEFKLHDDDIQAIQMLYGTPEDNKPVIWTERPLIVPPGRIPPCNTIVFDAITSHSENGITFTYAFFGKFYALLDSQGIVAGWPSYIAHDWPSLPSDLDAALYWPATHEEIRLKGNQNILIQKSPARTYFFKGHLYWRYQDKRLMPGYPKPIMYGFRGVPSYLDAAFVWSGNGLTYFIKGGQYYRYIRSHGVDYGYPRPLRVWRGLPSHIDSAFTWSQNKRTYFFSNLQYYRFSDINFRVDFGYPRNIGVWWLNCSLPNQSIRQAPTKSDIQIDQHPTEKDYSHVLNRGSHVQTCGLFYRLFLFYIFNVIQSITG